MITETVHRAYRFRLRPKREQERQLVRFAGARRFIWNWALAERQNHYREHGVSLSVKVLSDALTALKTKSETLWLREIDSQLLQQALADLQRAFVDFFERRANYPRFKSKKSDPLHFRIPQRVKVQDGHVIVPKIGMIRLRQSRPIEGTVKSATFSRDATGAWYVSLIAHVEVPIVQYPNPDPARVVGVDVGLMNVVALSDGQRIEAPRLFRVAQAKLRRVQRDLSRKHKGSHNYAKVRRRLARMHRRVADQRHDFLHKLTTSIICEHTGVCIEDLSVRGLAKTKLSKSVQDAGLGELRRQLEYKGAWQHKPVVVIGRFYPSSKRCNRCGHINHDLTLADRLWQCPACSIWLDRDHNAAVNIKEEGLRILALGHRESQNACGAAVRPGDQACCDEASIRWL